jgi:hypothetical protein
MGLNILSLQAQHQGCHCGRFHLCVTRNRLLNRNTVPGWPEPVLDRAMRQAWLPDIVHVVLRNAIPGAGASVRFKIDISDLRAGYQIDMDGTSNITYLNGETIVAMMQGRLPPRFRRR